MLSSKNILLAWYPPHQPPKLHCSAASCFFVAHALNRPQKRLRLTSVQSDWEGLGAGTQQLNLSNHQKRGVLPVFEGYLGPEDTMWSKELPANFSLPVTHIDEKNHSKNKEIHQPKMTGGLSKTSTTPVKKQSFNQRFHIVFHPSSLTLPTLSPGSRSPPVCCCQPVLQSGWAAPTCRSQILGGQEGFDHCEVLVDMCICMGIHGLYISIYVLYIYIDIWIYGYVCVCAFPKSRWFDQFLLHFVQPDVFVSSTSNK